MDTPDSEKTDISSYDAFWGKWRTEQVHTITHLLATVFKLEEEARQAQSPSRLLKYSSKTEGETREKLIQIHEHISEYKQMLKLGLKRVEHALEKIDPPKPLLPPPEKALPPQKKSFLKEIMKKLISTSSLRS